MSKSKIIINKLKVIETSANNELINILIIVLIINEFIERRTSTKSVYLNQIAYVFDTVIKNKVTGKNSVKISSPWSIPYKYRELIIMACEKKFIKIVQKNNEVAFELDNEGVDLIRNITDDDLFLKIRKKINESVFNFKNTEFTLQNLIW
jgi:hypothetical protein